jgi:hypothetical protein
VQKARLADFRIDFGGTAASRYIVGLQEAHGELGEYWQATACRKNLTDVLPGCFATFCGVRRT